MIAWLSLLIGLALAHPLEGEWEKACSAGKVATEVIENTRATLTENFFWEPQCLNSFMQFTSTGQLSFPLEPNMALDFTFTQVLLTMTSEKLTEGFNQRRVCGFMDWRVNQSRDITGLKCELFQEGRPVQIPRAGDQRFGLYLVQEKALYFGLNDSYYNGMTPGRRPVKLSPEAFIKKETH